MLRTDSANSTVLDQFIRWIRYISWTKRISSRYNVKFR